MTRWATLMLCVAAVTTFAWCQAPATGDDAAASWVGVVKGKDVSVRSGPDISASACTLLSSPQKVVVLGERRSWLKILAPDDCYSVVEKDYVQLDATGKAGKITGDTVFARPAGPLLQSGFALIQRRLAAGEAVQVLGTLGRYYKIVSPPGAYFWIAREFVVTVPEHEATAKTAPSPPAAPAARKTADDERTLEVVPPPAARPPAAGIDEPPVPAVVTPKPPAVVTPPAAPPKEPAAAAAQTPLEAFQAAEDAFKAECEKPADSRDYAAVLAKYKAVDVGKDTYLTPYIAERVNFLQQTLDDQQAMTNAEKLLKDTIAKQKEYDLKLSQADVAIPRIGSGQQYAAKGVVEASKLFPGGATGPKRYTLRDAKTNSIVAYLQSSTGTVNPAEYEGKYVGVVGKTRFNVALHSDVIEAQLIVLLDEDVKLPKPPEPIVTPLPESPAKAPTPGQVEPAPPTPKAPAEAPVKAPAETPGMAPPAETPAKAPVEAPAKTPVEAPTAPITPRKELVGPPPPLPSERPPLPGRGRRPTVPETPKAPEPTPPEPAKVLPSEPVAPPETPEMPKTPETPKTPSLPPLLPERRPEVPGKVTPAPVETPKRPVMVPEIPIEPTPKAPAKAETPTSKPALPAEMPLPGTPKAPAEEPTSKPAVTPGSQKPLPPTGLPLVDPTKKPEKPPIDEKEFQ